jgi:hypothetical protein
MVSRTDQTARGWSARRYRTWLEGVLIRELLR